MTVSFLLLLIETYARSRDCGNPLPLFKKIMARTRSAARRYASINAPRLSVR